MDRRIGRLYAIIDTRLPPKIVGLGILRTEKGPGLFSAQVAGKPQDVYSCQLRSGRLRYRGERCNVLEYRNGECARIAVPSLPVPIWVSYRFLTLG